MMLRVPPLLTLDISLLEVLFLLILHMVYLLLLALNVFQQLRLESVNGRSELEHLPLCEMLNVMSRFPIRIAFIQLISTKQGFRHHHGQLSTLCSLSFSHGVLTCY